MSTCSRTQRRRCTACSRPTRKQVPTPGLAEASVALLGRLFTPSRYLYHGFRRVEAYIGYTAPSFHITNAAGFSTADFLRRVTTIAYRTRELRIARPESGIGQAERSLWQEHVTDTGTAQAG